MDEGTTNNTKREKRKQKHEASEYRKKRLLRKDYCPRLRVEVRVWRPRIGGGAEGERQCRGGGEDGEGRKRGGLWL